MSIALDVPLKTLYLQGSNPDTDSSAANELRAPGTGLHVTAIARSADVLAELRRPHAGWQALFISPSLPQNETLALITSLRRDRLPVAIVPIVDDAHQELFAAAVASGADDVVVRRGETLTNVDETIARIRRSPHLHAVEQRRRITVGYAGRDPLVWHLLDQVPFVSADRMICDADGACSLRIGEDASAADAVIIDEHPGASHPLQVLKSVKGQAPDLPVIVLTSATGGDIATAALELGADDAVVKTGIFRRRLIATLRRVHQRIDQNAQQLETKSREERLRQIVENVPSGILVIASDGAVLAVNGAAQQIFGAPTRRDLVGRDFREFVGDRDRTDVSDLLDRVIRGEAGAVSFAALTLDGTQVPVRLQAVVLERDARGGRGVVASITRAEHPVVSESDAMELAGLRDAVERMERHYAELEDARASERAAWETERRQFEERLEAAERLVSERVTLERRLDDVTAELARASHSFAIEREGLEVRLQELEAAARQAAATGVTQADLERTLTAVRDEQQQAIAAHALERTGWHAIRQELETRLRDLDAERQAEHAATVASLEAEVRRLDHLLSDERSAAEVARRQVEIELRDAREALWTEHTARDGDRAAAEAELAQLRAAAGAAAEQEESRRGLISARDSADATVLQLRTELERAQEASRALAEEYDATRARLIDERDEARRELEGDRTAGADRTAALEGELRRAHDRLAEFERQSTFERQQRDQAHEQTAAAARAGFEDRQAQLTSELVHVREQAVQREQQWSFERQQLQDAEARALESAAATRRDLEDARAADANERQRTITDMAAALERSQRQVAELSASLATARQIADEHASLAIALEAARLEIQHTDAAHRAERETWNSSRETLAQQVRDLETTRSREREAWLRAKTQLEADASDVVRLREDLKTVEDSLGHARAEHAAVAQALSAERAQTDRQRREMAAMRASLAEADERRADFATALDHAARSAEARIADLQSRHQDRVIALETSLQQKADQLQRVTEDAEAVRSALHADYVRAAEGHARLVASDAFGYAVTTFAGELVRCNDAFARIFGFTSAPDALTRTAGRLFPALSNRPEVLARLTASGQLDRIVSCVDRIDGSPVRLVESATLITDSAEHADAETLIEHIVVAGPAGPTAEEMQARRLQEVGVLTTAMVPEIESLATTLDEQGSDVSRRLSSGDLRAADVHAFSRLTAQIAALVHQLAAFSRRQTVEPEPTDLGDAVADAEPMLARLVGDHIGFSTETAATTPINARADDLKQLLTSLVTLARDVLPAGGSVLMQVRQDTSGCDVDGYTFGVPAPVLSVRASGYGVQFQNAAPALELVAQRCGGQLRVSGEPGWMVRFEVVFPRCGVPAPGLKWEND